MDETEPVCKKKLGEKNGKKWVLSCRSNKKPVVPMNSLTVYVDELFMVQGRVFAVEWNFSAELVTLLFFPISLIVMLSLIEPF